MSVLLRLCFGLVILAPSLAHAAMLENPQPDSYQSGIGIISGWACDAGRIEIEFNGGPPVEAAYGTSRGDTHSTCGDADNGFGLPVNWNLLGNGSHTVRALADGVAFATATVTVTTLGVEFLRGASGTYDISDFFPTGLPLKLQWQEAQQNFVLTDGSGGGDGGGTSGSPPHILENPAPGSFQSGIGIISGWVCDADRIEIQFDGAETVHRAGYGTSREDTYSTCGDTDNGFGLLVNWNLLGHGPHTVRALADGVEFASVTVHVTTLGLPWYDGGRGGYVLDYFPDLLHRVVVEWQESTQSFVIRDYIKDNGTVVECGRYPLQVGTLIFYAKCQEETYCLSEQSWTYPNTIGYICVDRYSSIPITRETEYICYKSATTCEEGLEQWFNYRQDAIPTVHGRYYGGTDDQAFEACKNAQFVLACQGCGNGYLWEFPKSRNANCIHAGVDEIWRHEDETSCGDIEEYPIPHCN